MSEFVEPLLDPEEERFNELLRRWSWGEGPNPLSVRISDSVPAPDTRDLPQPQEDQMTNTTFNLTPEEFTAIWVEELRSGRFTQGRNALTSIVSDPKEGPHLVEHDCCLGVACKLYIKYGGQLEVRHDEDRGLVYYVDQAGEINKSFLPDPVCRALGLDRNDPAIEYMGPDDYDYSDGYSDREEVVCEQLAELNDDHLGFEQIADLIEAGMLEGA